MEVCPRQQECGEPKAANNRSSRSAHRLPRRRGLRNLPLPANGDVDQGIPASGGAPRQVGMAVDVYLPSCRPTAVLARGTDTHRRTVTSPAPPAIEGSATSHGQAQVTEATTRPDGDKATGHTPPGAQVILRPSCREQTQQFVPWARTPCGDAADLISDGCLHDVIGVRRWTPWFCEPRLLCPVCGA